MTDPIDPFAKGKPCVFVHPAGVECVKGDHSKGADWSDCDLVPTDIVKRVKHLQDELDAAVDRFYRLNPEYAGKLLSSWALVAVHYDGASGDMANDTMTYSRAFAHGSMPHYQALGLYAYAYERMRHEVNTEEDEI